MHIKMIFEETLQLLATVLLLSSRNTPRPSVPLLSQTIRRAIRGGAEKLRQFLKRQRLMEKSIVVKFVSAMVSVESGK